MAHLTSQGLRRCEIYVISSTCLQKKQCGFCAAVELDGEIARIEMVQG